MPFVRGGHFTPSRKDDITNKVQPENETIPEAGYKQCYHLSAYLEIHILKFDDSRVLLTLGQLLSG